MAKKKAAKEAEPKEAVEASEPAPDKSKVAKKKIKVNLWRTKLHGEEIGPYQKLKYEAKTRWFSKNFNIEGIIEIDGKKKYIIAYNKDDWQDKPDEEKRLILRLFTIMETGVTEDSRSGGNFIAGIEMSMTHSLIQSYEVKRPAPVFYIQIPTTHYLIRITKGWRLKGTRWMFPLLPETNEDQFQMVKAKGTVGLGRDYDLYIGKVKIARVDMERVSKNVEIEIYDENYAKDKTFVKIVTLFGTICYFMKDAENAVETLYKKIKETGTAAFKPSRQELDLFKNPRMMRK